MSIMVFKWLADEMFVQLTDPLYGDSIGHRWIPSQIDNDAKAFLYYDEFVAYETTGQLEQLYHFGRKIQF